LSGYLESDLVYVSSPVAGRVAELNVREGQRVPKDFPLYRLEEAPEIFRVEQSEGEHARLESLYKDSLNPLRDSEIEALQADVNRAKAEEDLAERLFRRQEELSTEQASSKQELEQAQARLDSARATVELTKSRLATGKLSSRVEQVAAASAAARAGEAALREAKWRLKETAPVSPADAFCFEILYQRGEWVEAGRPVVVLHRPDELKVRAYVPQQLISRLELGQQIQVKLDGAAEPLNATLTFISPRSEFTPPVIFSREMRERLVYRIEAKFAPEIAGKLTVGQPVDVTILYH
jgi:HlyD family secretion protein